MIGRAKNLLDCRFAAVGHLRTLRESNRSIGSSLSGVKECRHPDFHSKSKVAWNLDDQYCTPTADVADLPPIPDETPTVRRHQLSESALALGI